MKKVQSFILSKQKLNNLKTRTHKINTKQQHQQALCSATQSSIFFTLRAVLSRRDPTLKDSSNDCRPYPAVQTSNGHTRSFGRYVLLFC